jgi:hypothetical protein
MISLNNKGEKVIASSPFFYTLLEGGSSETFSHCGDYQNVHYCFANNTKQGCGFCEFDYTSPCECQACEG